MDITSKRSNSGPSLQESETAMQRGEKLKPDSDSRMKTLKILIVFTLRIDFFYFY